MEWLKLEDASGHGLDQPTCSEQGQLEQVTQDHVYLGF